MAVSIYALVMGSLRSQVENSNDMELAAFARAVLEEYVVTFPLVPKQGNYEGVWEWDISETAIPHVAPSEYDRYFEYVQIEIRVGRSLQADTLDLVTVVARRAPGT